MMTRLPVVAVAVLMLVGGGPTTEAAERTRPDPETSEPKRYYAVMLATSAEPINDFSAARRLFPELYVYVTRGTPGTSDAYRLAVGFFTNPADPHLAKKKALAVYPNAIVTNISASEYTRIIAAATPAPQPVVAPSATAPARANPETDALAASLMGKGREALSRGDNMAAIAAFDQLLRLPPNRFTQDAQELAGLAHERNGEVDTARKEYALYLRLYPEGEAAERVRQRLAALGTDAGPALRAARRRDSSETMIYGGLSQYYYQGASKVETTTPTTTPSTPDRSTLSLTDQKALVTNLDLAYRGRNENFDNRIVFRDTWVNNFLPGVDDRNRVYAAYYEIKDRRADYSLRLGRQPGYAGGVLGRFDGALAGYAFHPQWRVNVVAGQPVDDWSIDTRRNFYGVNLEAGTFAEHWGGGVYSIKQFADGNVDRQAVGAELRYFDPKASAYALLDYDTAFRELNIALLQANWTAASGTSFNVLADHRKSPALQLTNALIGEPTTSIKTMLETHTFAELQQQALALTSDSDLYLIGLMQPVTTKWQVGGDVRMWRISGTTGTVNQPPVPGTGNVYAYTAQAIGTGVFARRDIGVFSYTLIKAPNYDGDSASIVDRSRFTDKLTFDAALRWYQQRDIQGTTLTRLTPTLRFIYQWRERVALESEIGVEDTTTKSAASEDVTRRHYWSLGYRWDF